MPLSRRQDLLRALPYARRYARALCGSQSNGDLLVAESLRELMAVDDPSMPPRLRLYQWISRHHAQNSGETVTQQGGMPRSHASCCC